MDKSIFKPSEQKIIHYVIREKHGLRNELTNATNVNKVE